MQRRPVTRTTLGRADRLRRPCSDTGAENSSDKPPGRWGVGAEGSDPPLLFLVALDAGGRQGLDRPPQRLGQGRMLRLELDLRFLQRVDEAGALLFL